MECNPYAEELALDKSVNNFSMVTSGNAAYRHFCNNMINVLLKFFHSQIHALKITEFVGKIGLGQAISSLFNFATCTLKKTPINIVFKNKLYS